MQPKARPAGSRPKHDYYAQTSYRVTKIHDATNSTHGFRDSAASTNVAPATTADWDFSYDAKGNIKSDKNKRITGIKYNHLNQPVEIKFNNSNNSVITYLYNASGQKVQKAVKQIPQGAQAAATTTTDYLSGFQYMNNVLQFFPTSEGYVRNTVVNEVNNYSYVYHYTDHLGNVRLSYAKDPDTHVLKILEENHYYPYGVKHTNYNSNLNAFAGKMAGGIELKAVAATVPGGGATEQPYNYKYNGIEYQEELLLNMYDMPLRDYDPASAKWFNIDPVTHYDQSPFMAMNGNPVTFSDPSGANGEQINTWHYAGSGSMNSFLNGGAGNLGYGDNMLGGSRNSFWMNNGSSLSGSGANPFSQSYSNLTINLNWNNLNLNTNINFTKKGIHVSSDNEVFLPGTILPAVNISKNSDLTKGLFEGHYNKHSPYVHVGRDMMSNLGNGLQEYGDDLALTGYGLTLSVYGAPVGIPLAAFGEILSIGGIGLNIGVATYNTSINNSRNDNLSKIATDLVLYTSKKVGEHYLGRIKYLDEIAIEILKQNLGLKYMLLDSYRNKNKN